LSAAEDARLHQEQFHLPIEEFSLLMKLPNVLLGYWIHCGNLSNQEASQLHDRLDQSLFQQSSSLFSPQTHVLAESTRVKVMDARVHHFKFVGTWENSLDL
jgi:hypothetical protein